MSLPEYSAEFVASLLGPWTVDFRPRLCPVMVIEWRSAGSAYVGVAAVVEMIS